MSGPKISIYALRERERKIINGQIRCEQRALACGKQIRSILASCSGIGRELDNVLAKLELLHRREGGQSEIIEKVKSLQCSLNQEIEQVKDELNCNIPTLSPKYIISEDALEEKKRDCERILAIKNKAQALEDKLSNAVSTLNQKDRSELGHSILGDISGVTFVDDIGITLEDLRFNDLKKKIKNELAKFLGVNLSKELADKIKKSINTVDGITSMENLTTFNSITVKKIFRDCEVYQEQCKKQQEEFAESLFRYKVLCDMAEKESDKKRNFADANELEKAIHEMEVIIVKQKEQTYISDCVDEVMQEMGYDLIGKREVTKKSGKQFKNELYQFSEGTAVNITYSPEGQISMELGGLAREDRIPTEEEVSTLTQSMKSFCEDFSEFERRMKAKGVIVSNRVALMPPTMEYATIINMNDYEIERGKQVSEINVASKRKKGIAEQKVLRREH